MIGYLDGTMADFFGEMCFIDVNGVGYRVFPTTALRAKLKKDARVRVYTYLNVRDDAMQLYGFVSLSEYEAFVLLIGISGVGPKAALNILSTLSAEKLAAAVEYKQVSLLTAAPGIGKKTAERIILELKGKLLAPPNASALIEAPEDLFSPPDEMGLEDAIDALIGLGYSRQETQQALKGAPKTASVQELIKFGLKKLSK